MTGEPLTRDEWVSRFPCRRGSNGGSNRTEGGVRRGQYSRGGSVQPLRARHGGGHDPVNPRLTRFAEPSRLELPEGHSIVTRSRRRQPIARGGWTHSSFEDEGQVTLRIWSVPRDCPADVSLERYGNPERAGDGFWYATVGLSELEDFDEQELQPAPVEPGYFELTVPIADPGNIDSIARLWQPGS